MIKENFINSEGWKENPKTLIHLNAPLTSFPIKGTKTNINRNKENIKKAVIWLSLKKKKPILLLTDEDYNENGMGGIFEHYKSSYETNIEVL